MPQTSPTAIAEGAQPHDPPAGPGLAARGLGVARGGRWLLTGLDMRIEPGAALVLAGANGVGKSSLLRVLAGLLPPMAGEIAWDGAPVAEDPEAHRDRVAWLGHADALKPGLGVADDLETWARLADPREAQARTALALDEMGLAPLAGIPGRLLSQGQRRRLSIARLLVRPARLWLLDEPTVALDRDGRDRLARVTRRHLAGGGVIVAASHLPLDLPGAQTLVLDAYRPAEDAAIAWEILA